MQKKHYFMLNFWAFFSIPKLEGWGVGGLGLSFGTGEYVLDIQNQLEPSQKKNH